jgi:cold-inducible RNA-binding protein
MKNCLYVGNLPRECTEEELRNWAAGEGRTLGKVVIKTDRRTGKSRGFGFVEMATEEEVNLAMEALRTEKLGDRELKLGRALREAWQDTPPGPRSYEYRPAPRRRRR